MKPPDRVKWRNRTEIGRSHALRLDAAEQRDDRPHRDPAVCALRADLPLRYLRSRRRHGFISVIARLLTATSTVRRQVSQSIEPVRFINCETAMRSCAGANRFATRSVLVAHGPNPNNWKRAEFVRSAPVVQTSTCSAIARASSTSIPRYRTVLSILVCPKSSCIARRLAAAADRGRQVPQSEGSNPHVGLLSAPKLRASDRAEGM
jgi:hypothetical protein